MEEIVCFAYGRVQNVMFRDFIARGARHLGLTGYVRNLDDGSVEFVAQGQKEKVVCLGWVVFGWVTNLYSILGVKTNSRFRKIWFEPCVSR